MFELSIKCSKDIDELHINFSDGTSTIVEKTSKSSRPSRPKSQKKKDKVSEIKDEDVNWDDYLGEINTEIINPPNIPDIPQRDINVAKEMENAEF